MARTYRVEIKNEATGERVVRHVPADLALALQVAVLYGRDAEPEPELAALLRQIKRHETLAIEADEAGDRWLAERHRRMRDDLRTLGARSVRRRP